MKTHQQFIYYLRTYEIVGGAIVRLLQEQDTFVILRYRMFMVWQAWGPGTFLSMLKNKDVPTIFSGKQQKWFYLHRWRCSGKHKSYWKRCGRYLQHWYRGSREVFLDLYLCFKQRRYTLKLIQNWAARSTDFALFVYDISKATKRIWVWASYGWKRDRRNRKILG